MGIRGILKDIIKENEEMNIEGIKDRDIDTGRYLSLKTNKIVTFTGFRRVGKTYTLYLLMRKLGKGSYVYLNFEDERIPESSEVLSEVPYAIEELYGKKPQTFFFDEIHIMPNWGKFLRRIQDRGYRLFVTGSSSKLGLKEIPTELRGRAINREIFPLSFKEFLNFKGMDLAGMHSQKEAAIKRLFEEYLVFGGLPEVVNSTELDKKEIIQEYYRTLVQRDLIERFNLKEEALLEATLRLLLNSTMVSISKLADTLASLGFKCSKNTISNYLRFMESTFFLHQALFYSRNVKDQMQHPRKVYLIDNGFIRFLSLNPSKARMLENMVAIELARRGNSLFYWKDYSGREVDFVVKKEDQVRQLIQVCCDVSNPETKDREIKSLRRAMDAFKLKSSLLLTNDEEGTLMQGSHEIVVMPAWKWLLASQP